MESIRLACSIQTHTLKPHESEERKSDLIKVLRRYLAGELHAAVYWVAGLTCPILIPLFLGDVVHDWVVMGMRREVLLSLGAWPQIATGGIGLALAVGFVVATCWGIIRKMIR